MSDTTYLILLFAGTLAVFAGTVAFGLTEAAYRIEVAIDGWLREQIGDRGMTVLAIGVFIILATTTVYFAATDIHRAWKHL